VCELRNFGPRREAGTRPFRIQVDAAEELAALRQNVKRADLSLFDEGQTKCCYTLPKGRTGAAGRFVFRVAKRHWCRRQSSRSEEPRTAVPDPLHQPAAAQFAFTRERLRSPGGTPEVQAELPHELHPSLLAANVQPLQDRRQFLLDRAAFVLAATPSIFGKEVTWNSPKKNHQSSNSSEYVMAAELADTNAWKMERAKLVGLETQEIRVANIISSRSQV
jgi:hypothetical protein